MRAVTAFARSATLAAALMLPAPAMAARITVFAAASLQTAFDRIATAWQAETGISVVMVYAGSAALARQIQQGAPADVFVSAAVDWMDVLQTDKLIVETTRRDLLGNRLVLVAAGRDAPPVEITAGFGLAGLLGDGRLAMGLVDSVPAGQYGKAALITLGVWDAVAPKVAQAENARAAMALVTTGEAPFGIIYASDAVADDAAGNRLSVVGTFPGDSHPPILYSAAVLTHATGPEAAAFLDSLSSDAARADFEAQGFIVLDQDPDADHRS